MNISLRFDYVFDYRPMSPRPELAPAIPIRVIGPKGTDDIVAGLDTGAAFSLFDGRRASILGLELRSGRRVKLTTLAGGFEGWLHRVTIEIGGSRFSCEVLFSDQPIFREVLRRHTVFAQMTFAIREKYQSIYFSPRP